MRIKTDVSATKKALQAITELIPRKEFIEGFRVELKTSGTRAYWAARSECAHLQSEIIGAEVVEEGAVSLSGFETMRLLSGYNKKLNLQLFTMRAELVFDDGFGIPDRLPVSDPFGFEKAPSTTCGKVSRADFCRALRQLQTFTIKTFHPSSEYVSISYKKGWLTGFVTDFYMFSLTSIKLSEERKALSRPLQFHHSVGGKIVKFFEAVKEEQMTIGESADEWVFETESLQWRMNKEWAMETLDIQPWKTTLREALSKEWTKAESADWSRDLIADTKAEVPYQIIDNTFFQTREIAKLVKSMKPKPFDYYIDGEQLFAKQVEPQYVNYTFASGINEEGVIEDEERNAVPVSESYETETSDD